MMSLFLSGLYADTQSGRCLPCDKSCMDCSEFPSRCIKCWEPKFLTQNGHCVSECDEGFYGNQVRYVCEPCSNDCVTCADGLYPNRCLTCMGTAKIYNNRCISQCPNNTLTFSAQGSVRSCLETCPVGYYSRENNCELCSSSCKDCMGTSVNCSSCLENHFLQATQISVGISYQCWKSCDEGYFPDASSFCRKCTDANCLQCYIGGEYCKICKSTHKLEMGKCVKSCSRGLYLNENACTHGCPEVHYGDKATRQCERCQGNCRTCSNATYCTSCNDGFYAMSGSCVRDCGSDHISRDFSSPSDVRIIGGDTPLEGRIEVQYAGM